MDRPSLDTLLPEEMKELRWKPLMKFFVDVKPPFRVGKTPSIDRQIAEVSGGYFEGEKLRGEILPSGSDWQIVREDSTIMINVRTILKTDDGALISMAYQGLRHGKPEVIDAITRGEVVSPMAYYMRVALTFETASEKYGWLNRIVSVAHGHRIAIGAIYQAFEIV